MSGLLFIGAHPDDETFFAAGTFARCSAAGVPVAVVCATRGQAGKTADVCSREELPRVREAELRRAMSVVGVYNITLLDYEDKHLAEAPMEEMREHLVRAIRCVQPTVVMTFDPHGGNKHPDHIAISRFTADAVHIAADGRWLPELGVPFRVPRLLWTPPVFLYKMPPERCLRCEPGFDFLMDVSEYRGQKEGAFRAHATQFPGLKKLFFDDPNGQRTFHLEAFRFAGGMAPLKTPDDDLFSGLL